VKRINKVCGSYPCHKKLEDCTFCYCPFYPCNDDTLGKYIGKGKKKVWDCSECTWIHKKDTVDTLLNNIRFKLNLPTIEDVDRKSYEIFPEETKCFKGDLVSFQIGFKRCYEWICNKIK